MCVCVVCWLLAAFWGLFTHTPTPYSWSTVETSQTSLYRLKPQPLSLSLPFHNDPSHWKLSSSGEDSLVHWVEFSDSLKCDGS